MPSQPKPDKPEENASDCMTLDFRRRSVNLQELSQESRLPKVIDRKLPPVPGRVPVQTQVPGVPPHQKNSDQNIKGDSDD